LDRRHRALRLSGGSAHAESGQARGSSKAEPIMKTENIKPQ